MNTRFEKKNIHKHTWQHPDSKQWHWIDYIIMRQKAEELVLWCVRTEICRLLDWPQAAECSDELQQFTRRKNTNIRKKYDVSALQSKEISRFSQKVCELVDNKWDDDLNGSDAWDVIRDGMKKTAQEVLGWERRKQPDWFRHNSKGLEEWMQSETSTSNNVWTLVKALIKVLHCEARSS